MKIHSVIVLSLLFLSSPLVLDAADLPAGVGSHEDPNRELDKTLVSPQNYKKAMVKIASAHGKKVAGQIHFVETADGVKVVGSLTGLKPNAEHGIHIHEKGDCSAADFSSAGGHFNPKGQEHGGPEAQKKHMGDFGNLRADDKGHAEFLNTFKGVSFTGESGILGRAVVVHDQADDFKTQPSGNSGARIGCGVIETEK